MQYALGMHLAKTPIVTDLSMVIKVVIMMVCVLKGKKKFWKEEEFELKKIN